MITAPPRRPLLIAAIWVAFCGAFAFLGCGKTGSAQPAKVSGIVTFHGRALSGGTIVFSPDPDKAVGGKMMVANISQDGRFQLADGAAAVVPGWYRVAIADGPSSYSSGFPDSLRRPDRSGLEREVKAGHDHHFEFLIELTR